MSFQVSTFTLIFVWFFDGSVDGGKGGGGGGGGAGGGGGCGGIDSIKGVGHDCNGECGIWYKGDVDDKMLARISNREQYRPRFAKISKKFENRIDPNHKKKISVTNASKIVFFLV